MRQHSVSRVSRPRERERQKHIAIARERKKLKGFLPPSQLSILTGERVENRKVTRYLPRASPHHIGVCYPTCSVAARNSVRQKTSHDAASPVICLIAPHGCTYQLSILAGNTQHGGLIGSFLLVPVTEQLLFSRKSSHHDHQLLTRTLLSNSLTHAFPFFLDDDRLCTPRGFR